MIPVVITTQSGNALLPAIYVENSLFLMNNLRSRGTTSTETINLQLVIKGEFTIIDIYSILFYDFDGGVYTKWDSVNREFTIL